MALLVLGVAGTSGAAETEDAVATAPISPTSTLDPKISEGEYAETIYDPAANVSKAKLQVKLPTLYLRGFLKPCYRAINRPINDPTVQAGAPCPSEFRGDIPAKYQLDPNEQLLGGYAEYYFVTRNKAKLEYGLLPTIRIKALAFAAVPIEADVSLAQSTKNGFIEPVRVDLTSLVGLKPSNSSGKVVWPGYPAGPSLPPSPDIDIALNLRTVFDAPLNIRVSNVKVDGLPVEVGSKCRTITPGRFVVNSPRGYYAGLGEFGRKRGTPTGFIAINDVPGQPPGTFDGTLDIPRFTGCGTATQNLNPLVTAFASSQGNRVSGGLPRSPISYLWCSFGGASPIADCPQAPQSAVLRRIHALNIAIAQHKSAAVIAQLGSKLGDLDTKFPRVRAPKR